VHQSDIVAERLGGSGEEISEVQRHCAKAATATSLAQP
jgi:hypothetical protein